MDTDDLSDETYKGVISESEKFHHDLTLQFGLLSSQCLDEGEFLYNAVKLIEEFKTYKAEDLQDIFYDNEPDIKYFKQTLKIIEDNIRKIERIP